MFSSGWPARSAAMTADEFIHIAGRCPGTALRPHDLPPRLIVRMEGGPREKRLVRFIPACAGNILFSCARGDRIRRAGRDACRNVSIHAPARGATGDQIRQSGEGNVSIHAPARGATTVGTVSGPRCPRFNPRPCARGDPIKRHVERRILRFQSTPLREGRQIIPGILCRYCWGFNPRPCARGDGRGIKLYDEVDRVSIHAPARGATRIPRPCGRPGTVSIHAPARGATFSTAMPLFLESKLIGMDVSIHALREGDPGVGSECGTMKMFQSTPLREATRSASVPKSVPLFQSTPLREATPDAGFLAGHVSIHAPARATLTLKDTTKANRSFNPRPCAGDAFLVRSLSADKVSIHALRERPRKFF